MGPSDGVRREETRHVGDLLLLIREGSQGHDRSSHGLPMKTPMGPDVVPCILDSKPKVGFPVLFLADRDHGVPPKIVVSKQRPP